MAWLNFAVCIKKSKFANLWVNDWVTTFVAIGLLSLWSGANHDLGDKIDRVDNSSYMLGKNGAGMEKLKQCRCSPLIVSGFSLGSGKVYWGTSNTIHAFIKAVQILLSGLPNNTAWYDLRIRFTLYHIGIGFTLTNGQY